MEQLGRVPRAADLKLKKWTASYSTYKKHFGNWKKSLKAAGISIQAGFTDLKSFKKRKRR